VSLPQVVGVRRGRGWILASALLLGLAHPPFHLLFPSFTALVPFGVWLGRLPPDAGGQAEALRGGFLLGLIYQSLVLHWLLVSLLFYTWWAIFAFLVPVLSLAVLVALGTVAMHQARIRLRWPLWLALPVFWTAAEWVPAHLGPLSFPWMGLGNTLTSFPWLVGAADIVGSRGLTFWLALSNGLLAAGTLALLSARTARRRIGRLACKWTATGAVVLLLPPAYSLYRWRALDIRSAAEVILVQPNIPEDLKLQVDEANRRVVTRVELLLRPGAAGDATADLILLPETTLQAWIEPVPSLGWPGHPTYGPWVESLARRLGAALLIGAWGLEDRGDGTPRTFNSALFFSPAGAGLGRYDKRRLVPGVERAPLTMPGWMRQPGSSGGFAVGVWTEPFELAEARFGVLICYEAIYQQLSRRHRAAGADFLVNISNDAWFGRAEPWWSRTAGLVQHPSHLVMRAIENRVGIARAANTGISGVIDPLGRWQRSTRLFEATAVPVRVQTTDRLTLFTRLGDVVGWLSALSAAAAILTAGLRGPDATGDGRVAAVDRAGDG
jgi:apolipoprotein N-acyltransferase